MIIVRLYKYIMEHIHNWIAQYTKEPTCTESGYTNYQCPDCGRTYTNYTPALGHLFDGVAWQDNGSNHIRYCPRCSDSQTEDHVVDNYVTISEPTCEESGTQNGTCTECGHVDTKLLPALGHNWQHYDGQAPTCTEPGWDEYDYCPQCKTSSYEEIPPIGHDFSQCVSISDTQHRGTCRREGCGEIVEDFHDADAWDADQTYHRHKCSACGYVYVDTDVEHANTYSPVDGDVHTPTCTVCGYVSANEVHDAGLWKEVMAFTWQKQCTACGHPRDTFSGTADELPHEWIDPQSNGVDAGTHTYACRECLGTKTEPHNYQYHHHDEYEHYGQCTVCEQKTELEAHEFEWGYGIDHHWEQCIVCGYKSLSLEKHDWIYDANIKIVGAIFPGYICSVCGAIKNTDGELMN